MKRFEVYRNIRKQAVIFGLPISLFAVMMICIVTSLLVMIFSFNFAVIIGLLIFNSVLYIALTRITHNPQIFQLTKVFPKIISNKRNSGFEYEQD
jgi:multisubunit Na+/H+ antiporter MnhG subunit